MEFDDMLAAAEAAPTPYRDVRVCVNPTVARERAALLQAVEVAKRDDGRAEETDARLGGTPVKSTTRTDAAVAALEAFDGQVLTSLVTLRFTRMDGDKWALLTSAHPMRVDVVLDRRYGYNFDAVSDFAARQTGVRLDDDGAHELTNDQWTRLLKILPGHDVERIRDAVWTLNEYEPSQHIEALVKDFAGA